MTHTPRNYVVKEDCGESYYVGRDQAAALVENGVVAPCKECSTHTDTVYHCCYPYLDGDVERAIKALPAPLVQPVQDSRPVRDVVSRLPRLVQSW